MYDTLMIYARHKHKKEDIMHKHPTPLKIKNAILIEMIKAATDNNISPTITVQMFQALDAGIKRANREHDEIAEILNA
jgi:hypothetical protein